MTNHYKKLVLLLVLATSVVTILSCRKEISDILNDQKAEEIQWAKDYFNNVLLVNEGNQVNYKGVNTKSVTKTKDRPNFKTPLWAKAKLSKNSKYTFVEVPIKYTEKISRAILKGNDAIDEDVIGASFDRLIIYKDSRGSIGRRIISYIPDKAYLTKHKYDISHNTIASLDKDFSGYLRYADWDGTPLSRLRIEKGKSRRTKKLSDLVGNNKTAKGNSIASKGEQNGGAKSTMGMECYDVWEIEYSQTCYYENPDDIVPKHCDPPVEVNRTWIDMICEDDGMGDPSDCSDPSNFGNPACEGSPGEDPDESCTNSEKYVDAQEESQDVSSFVGPEIAGKRSAEYKWVFLRNGFGLWNYVSTEDGVHKKVGNHWEWDTLVHRDISRNGLVIGATVQVNITHTNPTVGTYAAGMELTYSFNSTMVCKGFPISADANGTVGSPVWQIINP